MTQAKDHANTLKKHRGIYLLAQEVEMGAEDAKQAISARIGGYVRKELPL